MKPQIFWNVQELEPDTDSYVRLNQCSVRNLQDVLCWLGEQMPVINELERWSYMPAVDMENIPCVSVIFIFKDPEDALMFKLAWG